MGLYRDINMDLEPGAQGITWAKEGSWITCLGVPIGNELNVTRWWQAKVAEVREKSKRWAGLLRSSYAGRNLIVQGCYFGRLRYWLYTLPLPLEIRKMVQADADTLWWSREPTLPEGTDNPKRKRFRRFVAKDTAIGPKHRGGVGNKRHEPHRRAQRCRHSHPPCHRNAVLYHHPPSSPLSSFLAFGFSKQFQDTNI